MKKKALKSLVFIMFTVLLAISFSSAENVEAKITKESAQKKIKSLKSEIKSLKKTYNEQVKEEKKKYADCVLIFFGKVVSYSPYVVYDDYNKTYFFFDTTEGIGWPINLEEVYGWVKLTSDVYSYRNKFAYNCVPTNVVYESQDTKWAIERTERELNEYQAMVKNKVIFKEKDVLVVAGKTKALKYKKSYSDDTKNKIIWTSSDESIATVDQDGKLKAISNGKVKITAQMSISEKKTSCSVQVYTPVKSINPVKNEKEVFLGDESFSIDLHPYPKTTDEAFTATVSGSDAVSVIGEPSWNNVTLDLSKVDENTNIKKLNIEIVTEGGKCFEVDLEVYSNKHPKVYYPVEKIAPDQEKLETTWADKSFTIDLCPTPYNTDEPFVATIEGTDKIIVSGEPTWNNLVLDLSKLEENTDLFKYKVLIKTQNGKEFAVDLKHYSKDRPKVLYEEKGVYEADIFYLSEDLLTTYIPLKFKGSKEVEAFDFSDYLTFTLDNDHEPSEYVFWGPNKSTVKDISISKQSDGTYLLTIVEDFGGRDPREVRDRYHGSLKVELPNGLNFRIEYSKFVENHGIYGNDLHYFFETRRVEFHYNLWNQKW